MTLYHHGTQLTGPCFEVCLLRNFVFGVTWSPRVRPELICSRHFTIHFGPLTLIWWWPYQEQVK